MISRARLSIRKAQRADRLAATTAQVSDAVMAAQTWFEQATRASSRPTAIAWQRARITGNWVVAPLADSTDLFASMQKKGYRYLVVQVPASGPCTGRIVELVLSGPALRAETAAHVALQAVKPFLTGQPPTHLPNLSGWVILYSPTYRYQTGLVYQDGRVQPQRVQLQIVRPAASAPRQLVEPGFADAPTASLVTQSMVCIRVTRCGTVNGQDAGCTSYSECMPGDKDEDEGGGDGGAVGVAVGVVGRHHPHHPRLRP